MKLTTKIFALSATAIVASSIFFACKKNAVTEVKASQVFSQNSDAVTSINEVALCGFIQQESLTAGQTIPAGYIEIGNDADNLYVAYNTTGGWLLQELHLSVECNIGGDCTKSKSSDIAPGKFPYKQVFTATTDSSNSCNVAGLPTTYIFTIPRSSLGSCSCFCIYPHAVVVRCSNNVTMETQTAWGGNVSQIVNGKWYGGSSYCMQTCAAVGK